MGFQIHKKPRTNDRNSKRFGNGERFSTWSHHKHHSMAATAAVTTAAAAAAALCIIANDVCKKMTFKNPLYRIIIKINLVKCELVLCEGALKHRLARHNFIKIVFACNFIWLHFTPPHFLSPFLSALLPSLWWFNFREFLHSSGNLWRNILPHENLGNLISANMYKVMGKKSDKHTEKCADFDANDSLHMCQFIRARKCGVFQMGKFFGIENAYFHKLTH